MQDNAERWRYLCQQASIEQDPDKLLALVKEINELLQAKEARLQRLRVQRETEKNPPTS